MVSPIHNNVTVSRALERQMRNWELGKAQHPSTAALAPKIHPFVTISQMVGAGGEAVAEQLGKLLGWPVFDKQLLLTMAVDDTARAHILASMDERDPNWFERTFRSLEDVHFRKADYIHRLRDTVLGLNRQADAIFLGRAVDRILPAGAGLRVRIVAPLKERIARISEQHHLSEREAAADIIRMEREQNAWVQHHFHVTADDCSRFDLMLSTVAFRVEQMVQLILHAMRQRGIAVEIAGDPT